MFESITNGLNNVFRTLAGKGKISEGNVQDAVREVRLALLEADVNMNVARAFVERVREQALGEKVLGAVDPGQQFVKLVHDELVKLLGGEREGVKWAERGITTIMLCGLQGCGKTTTCAKLAARFKAEKRRPLLVAADVQRPAAIEQLRVLGRQIGVPVHAQEGGDPVQICSQALAVAGLQGVDTVILDTAGRLHVDEALMLELDNIRRKTSPREIIYVCDAMIGQSAVDTAVEFNRRLPLTGAVMTKLDSDARGGGALSLREVTGVPVKYVTVGEKLDAIEEFHPDRMAGRILGMGDVVSLVEKAQEVVDEQEAKKLQQKLEENSFDLTDFLKQMSQIRKMGGLTKMLSLLPGFGQIGRQLESADLDGKELRRVEAIIQSMTPDERSHPEILGGNRRKRVADGSGTTVKHVADLLKQFGEMRKMVGKMGKRGLFGGGGIGALNELMSGGLPGMMGGGSAAFGSKKQGGKVPQQKDKKRRKKEKQRKRRK